MAFPPGALHLFRYDARSLDESEPSSLDGIVPPTDESMLWLNVNGTAFPEALRVLAERFGVHALTLEDIQHTHQRPKVEEYPNYVFIVAQMLKRDETGSLDPEQVSILLGDRWLITIQEGKPGDVFGGVRERLRHANTLVRKNAADHLAYGVLDALVDAFFPMLEEFSTKAEELEEVILTGRTSNIRSQIQFLRRDLLTLRRIAWPQRDALATLERGDSKFIRVQTRTFMRDVTDHSSRVIDFVETQRDLMSGLMDLHMANVAQRTNDVMKVLTVVGTIFLPLTFIVGVYGMNFDFMPELHVWWAYPSIMGFMAVVGVTMYVGFRRKGWV